MFSVLGGLDSGDWQFSQGDHGAVAVVNVFFRLAVQSYIYFRALITGCRCQHFNQKESFFVDIY